MNKLTIQQLQHIIPSCWSQHTSSLWTPECPARGQCSVTALVVHTWIGGEIRKTLLPEGTHFYNWITNKRYDLTASQFDILLEYDDLPSSRIEAFLDTTISQYHALLHCTQKQLSSIVSLP